VPPGAGDLLVSMVAFIGIACSSILMRRRHGAA
jgi:hypothetical protein